MTKRKCSHALPEITWRPALSLDGPFSIRCPCGVQLIAPSGELLDHSGWRLR